MSQDHIAAALEVKNEGCVDWNKKRFRECCTYPCQDPEMTRSHEEGLDEGLDLELRFLVVMI